MNHLGLTATRFADEIGVQRSGISHILSGRNQPSYDFIVKTMHKFPGINIEWLLTGKGIMVKPENSSSNSNLKESVQMPDIDKTQQKKSEVTYVNNITGIIVLYHNGTFNHYDPAKQD